MPLTPFYRRSLSCFGAALLLLFASVPALRAQDDGGEDEVAIAGGRAVHGTVLAGGTADHLSLRDSTGAGVVSVVVTPNTRIHRARQPIHLADIHPGETIFAFGSYDEKARALHALAVGVLDSAELKRAEADFGKTYLSGVVLSLHGLQIAVRRPDGVEQTVAVDDNTSFRRGRRRRAPPAGAQGPGSGLDALSDSANPDDGESLTLADVHPGSYVLAKGALDHTVFTATVLRIYPPLATTNRESPR